MKHLRTTLLAFAMLFSVNAMMAQDRYQYATLILPGAGAQMMLSVNGSEYQTLEIPKGERQGPYDTTPALKQMDRMGADGWELFDTGQYAAPTNTLFVLRRKVQ